MTDSAHLLVLGGGLAGLSFAIALATEVEGVEITVWRRILSVPARLTRLILALLP